MKVVNKKGFTLIEILIVLVLIGIVFSMITLANHITRTEDFKLKEITYQVYNAMLIAQDTAITRGQYYAATINKEGYQLYQLNTKHYNGFYWVKTDLPNFFQKVTFPKKINNSFFNKMDEKKQRQYFFNLKPDIVFSPDGNVTPFELIFYGKERKQQPNIIRGKANGDIKMKIINESL